MIGQSVGHYRVVEKLGEGGMGVVYKAQDTKLDRTVALKFLPPQASETTETKARFLQEAKAAAALNHPNICTIHGVEESDGRMFIVMEYVDGGTLRQGIGSPSSPADPIDIAIQVGEALHEAHGKGIVHRDIKTDNIMLNARGQAKVMDFGLAKLKGTLKLTRTSSTVGTLAYMAPEQIQGGQVDARSDIFSFGVLLFELLTGRLPFRGEHEAAMMYSLLNEAPEQLTAYLPDASPELIHILDRSLEKDPNDRYQTVGEMVIDLRRLKKQTTKVIHPVPSAVRDTPSAVAPAARTTSVTINIPTVQRKPLMIGGAALAVVVLAFAVYLFMGDSWSGERIPIAVADFVNQTNEPELDGLSGMLITSLEQSRRLSVATRSRMYDVLKQIGKANAERIDESLGKEVARQANIGLLVTAGIRKFGKLYTIDLKVLDTRTNEYVFTAKEEGEGQENIPAMLDRLAAKTRSELKAPELLTPDAPSISRVVTGNMEAYQHYFRGEDLIQKIRIDDALEEFRKAAALDPEFALAHYRLAYCHVWRLRDRDAQAPLRRALELIDRMPAREQFLLRSLELQLKDDYRAAINVLLEAEKLFPGDKEIIYQIGDLEFHGGALASSAEYLERALTLDPTFTRALEHLSWVYRDQMRFEELRTVAERYAEVSDTLEATTLLRTAYLGQRKFAEAKTILEKYRSRYSPSQYSLAEMTIRLLEGDYASAERAAREAARAASSPTDERSAQMNLASIYPYQGRYRDALQAFDRVISLSWSLGDTASALQWQARKAYALAATGDRPDAARNELAATYAFTREFSFTPYWGFRIMTHYDVGDLPMADSINAFIPLPFFRSFGQAHSSFLRGQRELALRQVDSAIGMQGDLGVLADVFDLKGRILMDIGSYDAAILTFKAIENLPSVAWGFRSHMLPRSYYYLGQCYEKKGDRSSARASYQKLLTMWKNADPDIPIHREARARIAALK